MNVIHRRIQCLSTARMIGILLVVWGHSYPFNVPIPDALEHVRNFVYAFHMPLFIFISGYLIAGNDRPAGQYIARRSKRLLVPYFALSLLAYIPKLLAQQFLNDSVQFSFGWLIRSELVPRENVWGHFWYLPVIFFLSSFGVLAIKWMRRYRGTQLAALIISFSLLFLPETTDWFALEDLRKNLFYFVLGMVSGNWPHAQAFFAKHFWLLALPAAIAVFAFVDFDHASVLIACMMIGFVMWLGSLWNAADKRPWKQIEKYSYTIFLLSWPAQAVVEVVLNQLLHLPVFFTMVCMFTAGVTVPLVCAGILMRLDRKFSMKWIRPMVGM